MPSLETLLLDPISLTVFAIYAAILLAEAAFPARRLPASPYSRLRGVGYFALFFLVSSYLPYLYGDLLAGWTLFDLRALGTYGGAAVGLLVYELVAYGYHRSLHRSSFLFRTVHQLHHSAERLDGWSAFWFSPLDAIGWTLVTSVSLALVLGLTPEAVVLVVYVTTFLGAFQHANLRTPQWLGYLIQRPESHSVHHERGVHAHNYADLPIVDLVFGTFVNPPDYATETGYYDGASLRIAEMLLGRDVTTPVPTREPTTALDASSRLDESRSSST